MQAQALQRMALGLVPMSGTAQNMGPVKSTASINFGPPLSGQPAPNRSGPSGIMPFAPVRASTMQQGENRREEDMKNAAAADILANLCNGMTDNENSLEVDTQEFVDFVRYAYAIVAILKTVHNFQSYF